MPKSEFKKFLSGQLGHDDGVSRGYEYPGWFSTIEYVLEDASVRLRAIAYSLLSPRMRDREVNASYVISECLQNVKRYISKPHVLVYVLAFDKPSYVTLAKLPEQRKRDAALAGGADANDRTIIDAFFPAHVPLTTETRAPATAWAACLNYRPTRQRFVQFLMENVGHVLERDNILGSKMLIVDYEGADGTSAATSYTDAGEGKTRKTPIPEKNQIGEFDVSFLYWLRYLERLIGEKPTLVLTIDTDILMIGLLYAAGVQRDCMHILVQGKTRESTLWVRTRQATNRLSETFPGESEIDTVVGLVEAAVIAGSDFTTGFRGISHAGMMKAYCGFNRNQPRPGTRRALLVAQANTKKRPYCGSDSHRGGDSDFEQQFDREYAKMMFTLTYWCLHLCGRPDVFVDPMECHGDATRPGWVSHPALQIAENI